MPEKSAEEHLLRDSEMKCIICHAPSLPDHDLCEECDAFKVQLKGTEELERDLQRSN